MQTVTGVLQTCVLPKYLVVGHDDEDGYTTEAWFEASGPAYDHAEVTALAGATMALNMIALFATSESGRLA